MVLTSLKATLNIFSRWSPVYVPEIETVRHVKNNACAVEIKIKWMMQKHMIYKNTYRVDTIFCLPETSACVEGQGENAFLFYLHIFDRPEVYLFLQHGNPALLNCSV